MGNNITDILEFLHEAKGFKYRAYHVEMLERRINNRIINTESKNIKNYYRLLISDADEATRLVEYFMINVTHFFRDPLCFEMLSKLIIPDLISSKIKLGNDSIRIWSAGCSRGEEAYSVAILINEYLEHAKINLHVDLFATDYDPGAIHLANSGIYTAESLKEIKLGLIKKYFVEMKGSFAVTPELKSMVKFSVYDLLDKRSYAPSESIFGNFDLILCRNVLIYFNQEFQEFILSKLHKSLAAKGVLMLGESEVPVLLYKEKFSPLTRHCKIYRKTTSEFDLSI
jgi:chemotaxis methyl-accepting protein methylase